MTQRDRVLRSLKQAGSYGITQERRRGAGARLSEDQVAEIKCSPLGYRKLGAQYGVARGTIAAIRRGRTWQDIEAA